MNRKRSIFKPVTALSLALVAALLITALASANFTNGNFETGDFTGWTGPLDMPITPETIFLNNGLTGAQPFGWTSITRGAGGANLSAIVTSATDPNTNNAINMVHNGTYAARVNSQDSHSGAGYGQNANSIRQTFTVASGDVQPNGDIHMMFAYAPVMVDPGHSPAGQPYFFVGVKNLTTGQTLYEVFSLVNQAGYPWVIGASFGGGEDWYYMTWQEVDLVSTVSNPKMSVGDSIEIEVIASGCSPSGHPGYVYVDDFAFAIPAGCSPTLATIAPVSGPVAGGTRVTITGTNLDTVTALYIGTDTILPAAFVSQSATTIEFDTPGDPAGYVTVTVVNPCGSATFFNGYEYIANATPVAVDDSYATTMSVAFNGATVLVNDTDADLDPLTAAIVANPGHASAFTFNADGTFYYEPANGFRGTDTFTYMANDGAENSNVATVSITVEPLVATFQSISEYDGWMLETFKGSKLGGKVWANQILRLGDSALDQQYRSMLSFNASSMDKASVIVGAWVRMHQYDVKGTDPRTTHGNIIADVRKGAFGGSTTLAPSDWQAAATKANIGRFVLETGSLKWYRLTLTAANLQYINPSGITQFRVRFSIGTDADRTEDIVRFASGNSVKTGRPLLVVEYYIPHP